MMMTPLVLNRISEGSISWTLNNQESGKRENYTVLLSKFELMRKLRFQLRYDYVFTIKLLL